MPRNYYSREHHTRGSVERRLEWISTDEGRANG
jgi:hypothetical protein